ncbi:hypothetical protein SD71_20430 [Cohnella kolymensis]|uniref:Uncharacterized protein n=1 Tax=Cohnella kolymensis TaxID=1590652 RepID=A0ABR4ZZZ1_9BACL|nr:hypothetical protein [Cohnella kolymensis]KIL34391.1 hypothetical protein SD71_20430 [Cohnella kolymensis]
MAYNFLIEPSGYNAFDNEGEQIEKCKEWVLLSEKASKIKTFYYKRNNMSLPCSIIGYVDRMTAVIEFDNRQKHCIHPSYLKEMQASNFNQKLTTSAEESVSPEEIPLEQAASIDEIHAAPEPPVDAEAKADVPQAEQPKGKAKKEKAAKLQLPDEKVKMTATVKEFTTVPNNFSDNDDEVVIYENVSIDEPQTDLGVAWSSHSATLKKMELEIGDKITFEAKIITKKLTRHPVPYKINNPSKIAKEQS